ncbi:beta-lactamase-like protein [Naematelia encephala]|uniref:Cleavage and polyadenylation specificity factor subunit 2 n=1 Tax=Naematelia encephala TaxID=71784 RepID=A0A1Y2BBC1_9TREE|nr:beta-lactamase-like protein [Naematelia encephala]
MITLTPISASAASSSPSEPVCYLLELDEARILLDMGQRDYRASSMQDRWEYEEKVRELAPTLDLVLLSHSPTTYLSLYPYARAHWGLTCPVYGTQPTVEMGRVVCLADVESWRGEHSVPEVEDEQRSNDPESSTRGKLPLKGPFVPTAEEVHEAFDWIKAIRYNQPLHLGGDLAHLLLTPFPSGHVLGGTLFKLRSPTSGTVLYAVGMNHTAERHIDGLVGAQGGVSGYAEGVMRPDLLVVESGRSQTTNAKRRDREKAFLDLITSTLESNRSLLLPTDPSPRLLELLVLLDQHWTFKLNPPRPARIPWQYPLCLVSRTGQDMINFAKSLIEWMGGVIRDSGAEEVVVAALAGKKKGRRRRMVGDGESGPLDFRNVQFFASPTDLLQAYPLSRPKLVLAIPPTMSHGPSRWLFTTIAGLEGNIVLLTSRSEEGTFARDLFDRWEKQQEDKAKYGQGGIGAPTVLAGQIELEINSKVPLIGAELEAHLEAERLAKEREAAQKAAVDRSRRMLEADDLESDSESEASSVDDTDRMLMTRKTDANANAYAGDGEDRTTQMSFDIFVKGQQMRVGRGGGAEMARFRMFPYIEKRGRKVDDFGEGLDIGQWLRKGREIEEEGETEEVREAKKRKLEEEEKQQVAPEPPSKFITETVKVEAKASVAFVDMEGLHDGQAIRTILSDLQPRKMILVRGVQAATEALVDFLESSASATRDVFAPKLGQEIKIGEHVASYSIMLGDTISAGLSSKWSKFEGYEVAMIDGKIALSAGSTIPVLELANTVLPLPPQDVKPEIEPEPETDEIMVKSERSPSPSPPPHPSKPEPIAFLPKSLPGSLFVGDLRLAQLKSRLASLSIPAEFAGEGVLICGPGINAGDQASAGSIVAVRKLENGRIVLEGAVGKVYGAVRKEVYGGFARVAGV